METRIGECPLGSKCESVIEENGKQVMIRCPWYKKLQGIDPQTNEPVDTNDCAISWIPLLLTENSSASRNTQAAVEGFRNEMVKDNAKLLLLSQAQDDLKKVEYYEDNN